MPQPTTKGQRRPAVSQLPKGRLEPPTNEHCCRHQPDCPRPGTALVSTLGTTIAGLPE